MEGVFPEDRVKTIQESCHEPVAEDAHGNGGLRLLAEARNQHASQNRQDYGECLQNGNLFMEEQGGKQQDEGGRGIEQNPSDGCMSVRHRVEIETVEGKLTDDSRAEEHPNVRQVDFQLLRLPNRKDSPEKQSRQKGTEKDNLQGNQTQFR